MMVFGEDVPARECAKQSKGKAYCAQRREKEVKEEKENKKKREVEEEEEVPTKKKEETEKEVPAKRRRVARKN